MKKRTVIGLLLVALVFSVAGVGGTGAAAQAPGFCTTTIEHRNMPANGPKPDVSTDYCSLKYAGPNVFVFGAAYAMGKYCFNAPTETGYICNQSPVTHTVDVRLYYRETLLARCVKSPASFGWQGTNCFQSKKLSGKIPLGSTLWCNVIVTSKIAYEHWLLGVCGSGP
jgi:hypothetical protein